jgi:hypothetical protein
MTDLRESLSALAVIFAGLAVVALIVVGLSAIMPPREQRVETDFRAACAAVKGNAVWNGRHWECLK